MQLIKDSYPILTYPYIEKLTHLGGSINMILDFVRYTHHYTHPPY